MERRTNNTQDSPLQSHTSSDRPSNQDNVGSHPDVQRSPRTSMQADTRSSRAHAQTARRSARPSVRTSGRTTRVIRSGAASRTSGNHAAPVSDNRSFNPAIIVLLVLLVIAAAIAAVVVFGQLAISNPSPSAASNTSNSIDVASDEALSASSEEPQLEPDVKALNKLLGKETAAKLVDQAKTNEDAAWIASHVDSYASDGDEVQFKILKLAAEEPKALPYVRLFATDYPEKKANKKRDPIVPESEFKGEFKTNTPHFFQWDNRWGQTIYSSTTFGLTGCGPTSIAMVYQGITGKTDLTPYDMAILAEEGGYMAEFDGTGSGFFFYIAAQNDFSCTELDISGASIVSALQNGNIIIANLGEGFFTQHGHFFVLTGLTDDGKVVINDPYSYERSTQTWDADFIASESIALFTFSNDPYPWT